MKSYRTRATRIALFAASSFAALASATSAVAQAAPPGLSVENSPSIISNNNVNPNAPAPAGALDLGITGIGQMIEFLQTSPTGAGLGLCTGTLINPRTVIFAAHCVNSAPADMYGSQTGTGGGVHGNFGAITGITNTTVSRALLTSQGIPLSFGFGATNRCTGITPGVNAANLATATAGNGCQAETGAYEAWRNSGFNTNTGLSIFNVNQVWYDPRSVAPTSCTAPGSCFLEGDIAIATLDRPAFGIPTWAMLFSPLTEETHGLSIGYGTNGTSASASTGCPGPGTTCGGIDYRRRAVENMISTLSSLDDRDLFLFGGLDGNPQSLYQLDFDSPAGQAAYNPAAGRFDFDLFDGAALPREGITAGGDSGGPLIVDQKYSRPVIAATLSGGSRFFNAQRFSTYGTSSFYQPLFLFWDQIVANNPYVYAGNKAGDGNWEDGSHWVQLMDPNYMIDRNGVLVNDLPDTPALGVSGDTVKFGSVCFLNECEDLSQADPNAPGDGTAIHIAGGPGSTNFVPDNVEPVNSSAPGATIKARYYDVTLAAAGATTLSSTRIIDKLTINGATKLNITSGGALGVLGEINQYQGWTHVDGLLASLSDMMFMTGFLSGSGTLRAPYVTTAAAIIAPGAGNIGTLTVNGNLIMGSASTLFIDATRGSADKLAVTGGAGSGILTLSQGTSGAKPSIVFNKIGSAPRQNESYVIASGTGGVSGKFGNAYTFQGVLRPELTYGPNTVTATLRAGSLVTILDGQNATAIAFANALDHIRNGFYDKLWNLYGNVDWMNGGQLNATFNALSPANMLGETELMQDRQSRQLLGNVSDRLSLLGTGQATGISFSGTPSSLMQTGQAVAPEAVLGLSGTNQSVSVPMGRLSGFVTMGGDNVRSSYGDARQLNAGQHSRYFASGVEASFGDVMVGTAIGYAEARSDANADQSRSKLTQAAAYASLPLGKSAYVGGVVSAERASSDSDRFTTDTVSSFRLSGATHSSRYTASAEAGFRSNLGHGLSLNPRVQLGYSRYSMGGFREQGGETALELNSLTVSRLESRIGARLGGVTHIAGWAVRPQVQADYVRLLSGGHNGMSVSFAAAPDYDFALPLVGGGSGWMEVKGGVAMSRGKFSLGLSGQATAGDAPISDQRGLVSFNYKF